MIVASTAILRSEDPRPLGVFDTPVPTDRTVYCTERNVSARMRYEAGAHGPDLAVILKLSLRDEYQGERICIYRGVQYVVENPYPTPDGGIELTLAKKGAVS